MDRQGVLEFVKQHPISHMATLDGGKPRVRAMQTAIVDEAGLTFCTGSHKDLARQLTEDLAVELAYWDPKSGIQLRVCGEMECVDDLDVKTHIVEHVFPFLKPVVEHHGYDAVALFRLSRGETKQWTQERGHEPPEVEAF